MRRIAAVLALALAAGTAALFVVVRSSGDSALSAAEYHTYFLVGKHECTLMARGLTADAVGDVTAWSGGTSVEILRFGRNVPRRDRSAVRAGCNAAATGG